MSVAHLFPDLHRSFTSQEALVESNRCLYCFDAPCTAACPTHIDVPRFIKKISTGNLRGSALTILDSNLPGASCSRVCAVPALRWLCDYAWFAGFFAAGGVYTVLTKAR